MSTPQAPACGALAWAGRYRRAQGAGTAEARRPVPRRRALGSLVPAAPAGRRPGGACNRRRSGESAPEPRTTPEEPSHTTSMPGKRPAAGRWHGRPELPARKRPERRISDGPGLGAERTVLHPARSPAEQSPFTCAALAWAARIARPRGAGTVDQLRCGPLTPCGEAARRVGGDRGRVCGAGDEDGGEGSVVAVWPGRAGGRVMSMPCGPGDVDALHAGARRAWGWARGAGVRSGRPAWRGRPPGTCCVRRGRPWRPPRRCGRCGRCSRGGGRWRRR